MAVERGRPHAQPGSEQPHRQPVEADLRQEPKPGGDNLVTIENPAADRALGRLKRHKTQASETLRASPVDMLTQFALENNVHLG